MEEFIINAIAKWRKERDETFANHGLNVQEIYASGLFDELPADCLKAVCYVDAYLCVQGFIESEKNK